MNKEILKHYYDEGKKFGYALARGATDLPSVQTFDELYTEQLNKPLVMQAEGSDEHICKYCGVLTSQPDEDCYKNPNRAKVAAVGQRSVGTNAEGEDLYCFCSNGGREGLNGICTECGNYIARSSYDGHL